MQGQRTTQVSVAARHERGVRMALLKRHPSRLAPLIFQMDRGSPKARKDRRDVPTEYAGAAAMRCRGDGPKSVFSETQFVVEGAAAAAALLRDPAPCDGRIRHMDALIQP
jgi:hypothetical protein